MYEVLCEIEHNYHPKTAGRIISATRDFFKTLPAGAYTNQESYYPHSGDQELKFRWNAPESEDAVMISLIHQKDKPDNIIYIQIEKIIGFPDKPDLRRRQSISISSHYEKSAPILPVLGVPLTFLPERIKSKYNIRVADCNEQLNPRPRLFKEDLWESADGKNNRPANSDGVIHLMNEIFSAAREHIPS